MTDKDPAEAAAIPPIKEEWPVDQEAIDAYRRGVETGVMESATPNVARHLLGCIAGLQAAYASQTERLAVMEAELADFEMVPEFKRFRQQNKRIAEQTAELTALREANKAAKAFYDTCWQTMGGSLELAATFGPDFEPPTEKDMWDAGQRFIDAQKAAQAQAEGGGS